MLEESSRRSVCLRQRSLSPCAIRLSFTGRSRCREYFSSVVEVQPGWGYGYGGAAYRTRGSEPVNCGALSVCFRCGGGAGGAAQLCVARVLHVARPLRSVGAAVAGDAVSSFEWIGFAAGESCADANPGP